MWLGIHRRISITGMLLLAVLFGMLAFVWNLLFSPPEIHQGVIVEKVFVPSKTISSPYALPYANRNKTYNYSLQAQRRGQFIAQVRDEDGKIIKVNCTPDHYQTKEVGDTLLFKEFRGGVFHVDYFSHNDEDMNDADKAKLKKR